MDISKFKQKFLGEAAELLDKLEKALFELEKAPDNKDSINDVFRVMHTLKGVAGMFGFDAVAEITHELEYIYDLLREGKFKVDSLIIDLTLNTGDHIRCLLDDNKCCTAEVKENHKILLEAIKGVISNGSGKGIKQKMQLERKSKKESSKATYNILFFPSENLIKRSVNLVYVFHDLFELGEYKIDRPDTGSDHWSIFLVTDRKLDEIEEALMFVLDECKIKKIADFNIFNQAELVSREKEIEESFESIQKERESQPVVRQFNESQLLPTTDIKGASQGSSRISVDSVKLDRLMYLVSELITANSQLLLSTQENIYNPIKQYVEKIDNLSKQFRNNALDIRLVPVNDLVIRFQRLVRSLSKQLGKEVDLVTTGTETELDKNTIDKLSEPLMHIIRNSLDHGIETPEIRQSKGKPAIGVIRLSAYHSGNYIFLEIEDDGSGIDIEKIRLKAVERGIISSDEVLTEKKAYEIIFLPGFSTAQSLTEVSGRGVGMDVVRNRIAELRGTVEVTSQVDVGTRFTIKLQQSIAILDSMLVRTANMSCLVPVEDIEICIQLRSQFLEERAYTHTIPLGKDLIPYVSLREVFNLGTDYPEKIRAVVINKNTHRFAIVVDQIIGEHQAVVKSLGKVFAQNKYTSGMSILGDGNLALILDILQLVQYIDSIEYKKIS